MEENKILSATPQATPPIVNQTSAPPTIQPPARSKKVFVIVLVALLILPLAAGGIAYKYLTNYNKPCATVLTWGRNIQTNTCKQYPSSCIPEGWKADQSCKPSPAQYPDPTADWKTYTYQNISFEYPQDWVVVFDSKVANQPNGFSLHAQHKNAQGYQPDGFYLSTYDSGSNYRTSQEKTFSKIGDSGEDRIRFEEGSVSIFSSCAFYSQDQTILNICNQILSTFKFTQP